MTFPRGYHPVRTFVTMLLSGLILACPFLCGAAEANHVAHREHTTGDASHGPAPSHCPEDGDDCVCRGAVASSDVKVPAFDSIGLPLPLGGLGGALAHSPAHSLAHLTSDGTPAGLAL